MFKFKKKRNFVIMNGRNPEFVKEVTGLCEMLAGKFRVKIRELDREHSKMKVVTVRSHYPVFKEIRKILEERYPEQCIFNVPL